MCRLFDSSNLELQVFKLGTRKELGPLEEQCVFL